MIKSIAIGSFDGVHLAHQELIKRADGVVVIERAFGTLTPGWKRANFTKKATFFYLFEKIKDLTPKEFIELLKEHFKGLEKIVVGYDFKFGKDAKGDIESLKRYFDGIVEVVEEIKINNISVHSRVIREFIKKNNIIMANRLLNRNYLIDGEQVRGLGLGSKELVPTINLRVKKYTLPNGVFATYAVVKNKKYKSITFIGKRESVDNSFSIETHILEEFEFDFYDEISVEFIDFIRGNQKFKSLKDLKEQIKIDIAKAIEILKA